MRRTILSLTVMAVALVLAGGAALVGSAEPAQATFRGANGNFVYSGWDGDNWEIYTKPSAGGPSTKVTNNSLSSLNARAPAYSPDGSQIAYESWYGDLSIGIYIIPAIGGTDTALSGGHDPAWSPDGAWIAYCSDYNDNDAEIHVVSVTDPSNGDYRVTDNSTGDCDPAWSPDGQTIAYQGGYDGSNDSEIYTIPAFGGTPTQLTNDSEYDFSPSWSPDGSQIAFSKGWKGNGRIYRIPSRGGTPTPVTSADWNYDPKWSPDGSKIAFLHTKDTSCWFCLDNRTFGGGESKIYTVPPTGGTATQVTDTTASNNDAADIASFDWGLGPDTIAPVVTKAPTPSFVVSSPNAPNSTLDATSVPVKLTWSARDEGGSGLYRYGLEMSTNGGAYTLIGAPVNQADWHLKLDPGNTYRFRVYAVDKKGNKSAWAYGTSFTPAAYQENSPQVSYPSGTWVPAYAADAYGGYVKYAWTPGSTAKFSFTGRNVAWVATRAPNRGLAEVWVDGVKQTTVDLGSSTTQLRNVVFTKGWDSSGSHTIEVKALGTAGRPYVDVDAFVVLSSPPANPCATC